MGNLVRGTLLALGLFSSSEPLAEDVDEARRRLFDGGAASDERAGAAEVGPVELRWASGRISLGPHLVCPQATARECLRRARQALEAGDAALAVEWVMASPLLDAQSQEWLRRHPDAVIAALSQTPSPAGRGPG